MDINYSKSKTLQGGRFWIFPNKCRKNPPTPNFYCNREVYKSISPKIFTQGLHDWV